MKKVWLAVLTLTVSVALAGTSFAAKKGYKEGAAGGGSISGVVSLKGNPPPPIAEDLNKGKNAEFCAKHPDAKGNMRDLSFNDPNFSLLFRYISHLVLPLS